MQQVVHHLSRIFLTLVDYCIWLTCKQPKTRKLQQLCWHLATTCYKPISGCVSMACDSLMTTSLLQVVNRLVASWLFQQTCGKLFQQVLTSLQMPNCNKPDLNRLVATWWNWQAWRNLLTSCNKPVTLITCNNSAAFLPVYKSYPYRAYSVGKTVCTDRVRSMIVVLTRNYIQEKEINRCQRQETNHAQYQRHSFLLALISHVSLKCRHNC